ncbi:MAG: hypothetical protein ACLU37_07415 [Collinsella sp.]
MPWDRGAAVPAAQPATKSAAPAPAPRPVTPAPQPVAAPASAPAASTVSVSKPNNAAQVAAAGAAETPAVEDAGELQRKWAEVVERVKARQASYAGLLLNARATADDGSKLTVSFPRVRLCHQDARSRRYAVGGPADGLRGLRSSYRRLCLDGVARRLLNMRSILHLHGLRYLRTRNPCPRCPCILERQRRSKSAPVAAPTPSAPEPARPNRLLRSPRPSPLPRLRQVIRPGQGPLAALRQPCRCSCHGQASDRARAPCARALCRSQGSAVCTVCAVGIRAGSLRRCHGRRFCCRCRRG